MTSKMYWKVVCDHIVSVQKINWSRLLDLAGLVPPWSQLVWGIPFLTSMLTLCLNSTQLCVEMTSFFYTITNLWSPVIFRSVGVTPYKLLALKFCKCFRWQKSHGFFFSFIFKLRHTQNKCATHVHGGQISWNGLLCQALSIRIIYVLSWFSVDESETVPLWYQYGIMFLKII